MSIASSASVAWANACNIPATCYVHSPHYGTSTRGLDLSGFYSEKYGKAGMTVFVSRNSGSAYDPSNTGFTAIPKFDRYAIMPRLFRYGKKTSLNFGVGYISKNGLGGNINFVEHGEPGYFEQNKLTVLLL